MSLPLELIAQVYKSLDPLEQIRVRLICRETDRMCRMDPEFKALAVLGNYQVDYLDPTNFIYVANNVRGPKSPQEALELYKTHFNEKTIVLNLKGMTSFPVYPKMVECDLSGNKLRSFASQPEMRKCNLRWNQITFFPSQPKMVKCNLRYNPRLHRFPLQPKFVERDPRLPNNLKSLPDQPK